MAFKGVLLAAVCAVATFTHGARAEVAVKIGVLDDMAGIYADISGPGSVVAAQMAADEFMASHKGIKVTIISADHQNKPDLGASIARRWYDQEGVDVISDVTTSSVAFAVHDVTREKNKIFIPSGSGSSDMTGERCSPNTVHWTYDTWAQANATGRALTERGGDSWFFITADYAFGAALERDTTAAVKAAGGKVVGSVKHPLGSTDFSSYLLQAQSSGAKVIALANGGLDTTNAIKQAAEFGVKQIMAAMLLFSSDIKALGLQASQGLVLTDAFYWDMNDDTRAFSERFAAKFGGKKPTSSQAGVYSSILFYLQAVDALQDKDTQKVMAKMRATPVDDKLFGKGELRIDGRVTHPMYLMQVKSPAESKGPWDMFKILATIPADQAFRPLKDGHCPLYKG